MIKENNVFLLGDIHEILNEERTRFRIAVKKNDSRYVYPEIKLIEEMDEETFDNLYVGRKVLIEGKLATKIKDYDRICPCCKTVNTVQLTRTIVVTPKITFVESKNKDQYYNNVFLLGTLTSEPHGSLIPGSHTSMISKCTYTIESTRKGGGSNYPVINTFAVQAEEDLKKLHSSSQIIVNGSITTKLKSTFFTCECCSNRFSYDKYLAEVQGDRIEYLNNCVFEK